jgi:hypothetical protein
MSPKEKAEELVTKMYVNQWRNNTMEYKTAKQCALIAVDEIIANIEPSVSMDVISASIKYWEQVKQEIEKL